MMFSLQNITNFHKLFKLQSAVGYSLGRSQRALHLVSFGLLEENIISINIFL